MSRPYSRRDFSTHLAQRTLAEFFGDRCPQFAASIAYHVLFSLFPLAIVLAAVFGIVVRATGVRADVVDVIVSNVPLTASGSAQLRSLLEGATGGLSTLGLVGILGLLWAASGMMAALRTALNAAWDVEATRPFLKGKLVDVALVFAAAAGALASFGVTIAVRLASDAAPGGAARVLANGFSKWGLAVGAPLVYAFVVSFLLYRFVPAARVRSRRVWPVALGVACVGVLVQNLFALYVGHFGHYNAIYGALGAVVAFMFFVYLCALVFLLGAELASEWPRAVEAFERGEVEEGPPFGEQVEDFLRGLWVQNRQREAGADEPRRAETSKEESKR